MSAAQITVPEFLANVPYRIWLALGVLLLGLVLAYLTGVINRRL
ncbi:mechanosensitive ion channel family protein, partial [Halorubrum sp. SS7]